MTRSMTGYGRAETTAEKRKISVEIRSLNSKQLDLSVKMPGRYRSADPEVRSLVAKVLQRGKVDLYVNVESGSGAAGASIDKGLFLSYISQLRDISQEGSLGWGGEVDGALIASILRLPEVVCADAGSAGEEEIAALLNAVREALGNMERFRVQEGRALMADILDRIAKIESCRNEVTPYEQARIESVRSRIRENIEALGLPVDPNRLEQEIVYYVEKLDITEEKVRLANHCAYFREVASAEQSPGRKLGFIAQEIGREINTMGSKANDADIQRIVVGMKDELEKIKEQLLNIL